MEPPTGVLVAGVKDPPPLLYYQNQENAEPQQVEPTYHSPCTLWEKIYSYFMKKGVMKADGSPAGNSINYALLPLNRDELLRLKGLFHQKLTLRTASMEHSIEYDYASLIFEVKEEFAKKFPSRQFGQIYLSGSAVFKVLGWSYFAAMFEKLGLHDIPTEFTSYIQSELSKPLNDVDIRIWIPGITLEELETLRSIVIKIFDQKFYQKYGEIFSDKNLRPEGRHRGNALSDNLMARGYLVKSSIVNLYIPKNLFLITGFGDRIQNESELLWIGDLSRFSLAVNDAINLPVNDSILEEKGDFRLLTPKCFHQYPIKVFFDRILLVKTLDQVESIDRSGWGRVILDIIRGYTNVSPREEVILLTSMLEEAYNYGAGLNKIAKIVDGLREILVSHGGRSPQFRVLFALKVLSGLLNHVGLKSTRFRGKVILEMSEIEEIRRGLLKGLDPSNPRFSPILIYILKLLENTNIPIKLVCDYIHSCLFIAFLFGNEEDSEYKFFQDLKRSPKDIQVEIQSGEQTFWYRIPFDCLNELKGLKNIQGYAKLPAFHHLYTYLASHFKSTFRPISDLYPSTFTALCEAAEFLFNLNIPVLKSLGLRIALLILKKHPYPELTKLVWANLPATYIIDRENKINSQISIYKDLKEEESEQSVALEVFTMLVKARQTVYYQTLVSLIERYPNLLKQFEKICEEFIEISPVLIFRLWMGFHNVLPKDIFAKLFPKFAKIIQTSEKILLQIDLNFIFREAHKYLEAHPENSEFDSDLIATIRRNLPLFSYFPLLNLLTTGKGYSSNSKAVLDIWFNIGKDVKDDGSIGVSALSNFCERGKCEILIPILMGLTKVLKKTSHPSDQLFENSCRALYLKLMQLICTDFSTALLSREHSQWIIFHFFELGNYRVSLNKLLIEKIAKRVNGLLNELGDKISEKGWNLIEPYFEATFSLLKTEKLFLESVLMASCLMSKHPRLIGNRVLWTYLIEVCKEYGGYKNVSLLASPSLDEQLDAALNLDPISAPIACDIILIYITNNIRDWISSKKAPLVKRWKANLERLFLLPSSASLIGTCSVIIIKAHTEMKEWVEAAEILISKVKYLYGTALPFQIFLQQTLEALKKLNSAEAIQAQMELMLRYRLIDDITWDILYRKIPDLKNKDLSERAWDIFWEIYEPLRNSKIRNSILVAVTEALVKSQSPKVLEIANEDKAQKIRALVGCDPGQKYYRIFATLFLTGSLSILSKTGEIGKYAAYILGWRKPLSDSSINNINFRSIDIPLISLLSKCGDPGLLLEAIEVTKLLIKGDPLSVDNRHDDPHITERCRTFCDLIKGIVTVGDDPKALEEYCNYICKVGRLKEFHKTLLEIFVVNKNSKYFAYIYKFIYQYSSNLSFFKNDDSTPLIQGFLKTLTSMIKTGKIEYVIFGDVVLSNLKGHDRIANGWKDLFKVWVDHLVMEMEKDKLTVPDNVAMIMKHRHLLQAVADPLFFKRILNLVFTLEPKTVDDVLEKMSNALFENFEYKSVSEVHAHPLQQIRHQFLISLLAKNNEMQCWKFYTVSVEIVAKYIEVVINTPEEVFCITSLFTFVSDHVQRYVSVQTFDYVVKILFSLILSLKDEGKRHNNERHRFSIYHVVEPNKGCYLSSIPNFNPQKIEMKTVKDRGIVQVPESKSPDDFIHPFECFSFFNPPSQNSYYLNLIAVFIDSLLNLNPKNPIHKAYVMDMVYLSLVEMIRFASTSKLQKVSVNIYKLMYKFITIVPDSVDTILQHEFKCSMLLNDLLKINVECRDEELALCHIYITELLECKKRVFKLSQDKFRDVIITIIKDHCKVIPKALLIHRMAKGLKIFKDYMGEFIGSINHLQNIYGNVLEALEHTAPELYCTNVPALEFLESTLFSQPNNNHLKICFWNCFERLFKMYSYQPYLTMVKYLIKLLVRAKESNYFDNNWSKYFEFVDILIPFLIYHIEDEKEFYKVFLPLFDFTKHPPSRFFRSSCNKINTILKNLIEANKKDLALELFDLANRFKLYERYPQQIDAAKALLNPT